MIIFVLAAFTYAWCCYAAYRLLCAAWTETFDLTVGDAKVQAFFAAFGPVSLVVAVLVWRMERPPGSNNDRVLIERKRR